MTATVGTVDKSALISRSDLAVLDRTYSLPRCLVCPTPVLDDQLQWEVLDERAARAIAQSRLLIEERRRPIEEMADSYRRRYNATTNAVAGFGKAELDLLVNYKRWPP